MSARSPDDDRVEGTERQPRAWTKYVPGLAALREYDRAETQRGLEAAERVLAWAREQVEAERAQSTKG